MCEGVSREGIGREGVRVEKKSGDHLIDLVVSDLPEVFK